MRKILFVIGLCALGTMASLSALAHAAFVGGQLGARSAALGGSFAAVADDANAIFLNPAGVAQLSGMELTVIYARLHQDFVSDKFQEALAGLALPINLRSMGHLGIGLGWNAFRSALWEENTFTLSCSYSTPDGLLPGRLSLGGNIKRMAWEADTSGLDPILGDSVYSGPKLGLDAGMLWSSQFPLSVRDDPFFMDSTFLLRIGAFVRNFNEPDIAPRNAESVSRLRMEKGIGVSCAPSLDLDVLIIRPLVTAELRIVNGQNTWHAGGELSVSTGRSLGLPASPLRVVLRMGRSDFLEEEVGAEKRTIGIGAQTGLLALDCSYEYMTEEFYKDWGGTYQIQGTLKLPPDLFLWWPPRDR
ncbi:MAG: UPF0164 family protein [Candidatus Latescibacterota bacterium]